MKIFDDSQNETQWLKFLQNKLLCCGYTSPRDYKDFFKPSSCCDSMTSDNQSLARCVNPPTDTEGNLGESPLYFSRGCGELINKMLQSYNCFLLTCGLSGFFILVFYLSFGLLNMHWIHYRTIKRKQIICNQLNHMMKDIGQKGDDCFDVNYANLVASLVEINKRESTTELWF